METGCDALEAELRRLGLAQRRRVDLSGGDRLVVRRSESYTCMADLGLRNFYDIAFEKLR